MVPLSTRLPRAQVDDPRRTPGARRATAVDPGARGRSPRLLQHGHAGLRAASRRRVRRQPEPRDGVGGEHVTGIRNARVLPAEAREPSASLRIRPAAQPDFSARRPRGRADPASATTFATESRPSTSSRGKSGDGCWPRGRGALPATRSAMRTRPGTRRCAPPSPNISSGREASCARPIRS